MASLQEVIVRIGHVIREYNADAGKSIRSTQLSPNDHFCDDLGGDSMDLIALVLGLEDAFQISIGEDELVDANPWRLGNLATYVQRKMQESPVG
ncbi:MAG: hypothetical protein HYS14_11715 [Candidatus Rokubacteria bacterium]|nr:hypothetical protein [Candidatus Rokubacteria bacterium]